MEAPVPSPQSPAPSLEFDRIIEALASFALTPVGKARMLAEAPQTDREVVAYCRGPFCLFSEEAVQLLQAHGLRARKVLDGVSEWAAHGLPLVTASAVAPEANTTTKE